MFEIGVELSFPPMSWAMCIAFSISCFVECCSGAVTVLCFAVGSAALMLCRAELRFAWVGKQVFVHIQVLFLEKPDAFV